MVEVAEVSIGGPGEQARTSRTLPAVATRTIELTARHCALCPTHFQPQTERAQPHAYIGMHDLGAICNVCEAMLRAVQAPR